MMAFYTTLFKANSLNKAQQAMNDAISPTCQTISVFTADSIFVAAFRGYLRTLCTEKELNRREKVVVEEAKRKGLSGARLQKYRHLYRSRVRDHKRNFQEFKRHFLFCDLYPRNEAAFNFTFRDCTRDLNVDRSNVRKRSVPGKRHSLKS
jgi:hypothetical protein